VTRESTTFLIARETLLFELQLEQLE
jgi:hypothetical protein